LIDRIKSVEQNYKWVIYRLCFENYQNKNEIINTETVDQIILDSDVPKSWECLLRGKDRMTCSGGPLLVGRATNWLLIPVQAYAVE
jgi:hypothetical protein